MLDQLLEQDPNALPYFITEILTGQAVPVRFKLLTEEDREELESDTWAEAVFRDVWLARIGDPQSLKLVSMSGSDARIQGLIRIGSVDRVGGSLKYSLLESAPFNQYGLQQ